MGDAEAYRPDGEKDDLFSKDPIPAFRNHLMESGTLDEAALKNIEQQMQNEVDDAFEFARASSYPKAEEALEKVFA